MDYAIVESGGKQYVAREGQALEVDRLPVETGQAVEFEHVLLVADGGQVRLGTPFVEGMKVHATVAGNVKGDKIVVFRYIPKERYRKKAGHRQQYTRVIVDSIGEPSGRAARPAQAAAPAPARKKPAAKRKAASAATKAQATKAKSKPTAKKK
jgi:large subunit ribosomal protein L21